MELGGSTYGNCFKASTEDVLHKAEYRHKDQEIPEVLLQ